MAMFNSFLYVYQAGYLLELWKLPAFCCRMFLSQEILKNPTQEPQVSDSFWQLKLGGIWY